MEDLEKIPFDGLELKDDDLYYIAKVYDDDTQWEIMGIFEDKQKAFEVAPEGMAIVRTPRNVLYLFEHVHPSQAWWKIDGDIHQSGRFLNNE